MKADDFQTKRAEDRAYNLMGIFEINMPMIYGERDNAFIRLQQHMIQKSRDESIFAWIMGKQDEALKLYSGLYDPYPSAYADCSEVGQAPGSLGGFFYFEIKGDLSLRLRILPNSPGTYRVILHCAGAGSRVYVVLARLSNERLRDPAEISRGVIPEPDDLLNRQEIRVLVTPNEALVPMFFGFWLRTFQPPGYDQCEVTILSNCKSPAQDYLYQERYDQGSTCIICLQPKLSLDGAEVTPRWMKFGFDKTFNPVLWIAGDRSQFSELLERAVGPWRSGTQPQEAEKNTSKNGLLTHIDIPEDSEDFKVLVHSYESRRAKETNLNEGRQKYRSRMAEA